MVDSCRHCDACERGLEQYCATGLVQTSNGTDRLMEQSPTAGTRSGSSSASVSWSASRTVSTRRLPPVEAGLLITGRRVIAGSIIGGMPETQDVLDFCAAHGISCDIEMLDIRNIEQACERLACGDVRYRFVIDMATLKEA